MHEPKFKGNPKAIRSEALVKTGVWKPTKVAPIADHKTQTRTILQVNCSGAFRAIKSRLHNHVGYANLKLNSCVAMSINLNES